MIVSPLSKEKLIQIRIQKNEEARIKDGSNHNESAPCVRIVVASPQKNSN